jgi:hypothetical protein
MELGHRASAPGLRLIGTLTADFGSIRWLTSLEDKLDCALRVMTTSNLSFFDVISMPEVSI